MRRMLLLTLFLLVALLPQCVSLRMSDRKIDRYFANKTVKPTFGTSRIVNAPEIHYAQIGDAGLPMVLFIHGSPGNAAFAKRMLTNAPVSIQIIPKVNHFIPWNRPELIHNAILEQINNSH